VGSLTSHNPIGLQGLLWRQLYFILLYFDKNYSYGRDGEQPYLARDFWDTRFRFVGRCASNKLAASQCFQPEGHDALAVAVRSIDNVSDCKVDKREGLTSYCRSDHTHTHTHTPRHSPQHLHVVPWSDPECVWRMNANIWNNGYNGVRGYIWLCTRTATKYHLLCSKPAFSIFKQFNVPHLWSCRLWESYREWPQEDTAYNGETLYNLRSH
jgi:hypothetical protein